MTPPNPVRGTPIRGATALVTGGNRGFGRALVEELLDRGAEKIYATSRAAQPQWHERVVPLALDVGDDSSVETAARAAQDVSIVVNNAGASYRSPVLTAPLSDMQAELDTNLFGIIRVARAFAPILANRAPASMVNVLSVLSWVSYGHGYDVSKAAAWSATNALRIGLHDQGVTVTALHVAYMDTDMVADRDVPKADPREVARLTADAIVAGDYEILADEPTRAVKAQLCNTDITALYSQLKG